MRFTYVRKSGTRRGEGLEEPRASSGAFWKESAMSEVRIGRKFIWPTPNPCGRMIRRCPGRIDPPGSA